MYVRVILLAVTLLALGLLATILFAPVRVHFRFSFVKTPYSCILRITGPLGIPDLRWRPKPAALQQFLDKIYPNLDQLEAESLHGKLQHFAEKMRQRLKDQAGIAGRAKRAIERLRRSTFIERLRISLSYGSGEAASTGSIVGALWALTGPLFWMLRKTLPFARHEPALSVLPDFKSKNTRVSLDCIARFRGGDIILAALSMRAKSQQEVKKKWPSIRSRVS